MLFLTAKVRQFSEYTKYLYNYFAPVRHFFIYKVCSAGRTNIHNIQNIRNIHAPIIGLRGPITASFAAHPILVGASDIPTTSAIVNYRTMLANRYPI